MAATRLVGFPRRERLQLARGWIARREHQQALPVTESDEEAVRNHFINKVTRLYEVSVVFQVAFENLRHPARAMTTGGPAKRLKLADEHDKYSAHPRLQIVVISPRK